MMNTKLIILIVILAGTCAQSRDVMQFKKYKTDMNDTFDIVGFKANNPNGELKRHILDDGTMVTLFKGKEKYYKTEKLPKSFYYVRTEYYPTGKIECKGKCLKDEDIEVGLWDYFDEQGKHTVEDKDKRFGKFNYNDVYSFLLEKGYIDPKIGYIYGRFFLNYDITDGRRRWMVFVNEGKKRTIYYFDSETGELYNTETKEMFE